MATETLTATKFSLDQMLAAVRREIRYRKRVYPSLVIQEKMTQREANYQIAIMEELAHFLREVNEPRLL